MSPIDPFVMRFASDAFPHRAGPLSGLRLAIKDNFDVTGTIAGSGHPLWSTLREPSTANAPVVDQLLAAGARPVGKTHMDELAYSLMGQNAQYGTPLNPAAPERVPGGSSSGSASAVAQNMADIGLGTDTGGSVRLPAAFCGLWGWRPTHGLLPADGMQALAPDYDVPGILTRDAETLAKVAVAIAPDARAQILSVLAPADLWALVPETVRQALADFMSGADHAPLFDAGETALLQPTFRVAQGEQAAKVFGAFLREHDPHFGPGVRERFDGAMSLGTSECEAARAKRAEIRAHVRDRLGTGTVMLIPTGAGIAPRLDASNESVDAFRNVSITLLSVAGHAGLPQISIPVTTLDGAPLGLSVVGPAGSDVDLIAFARVTMTEWNRR